MPIGKTSSDNGTPPEVAESVPQQPSAGRTADGAITARPEVKAEDVPQPTPVALKHYTHSRQKLSVEKLNSMSKPEIRAVASDRGYKMREGGRASIIRQFLDNQEHYEDPSELHEPGSLPEAPVVKDISGTHGGSEEEINARPKPQVEA